MSAIKRIFGWVGRKTLLYALLVVAILASTFIGPWIKAQWTDPAFHLDQVDRLEGVRSTIEAAQTDAARQLSEAGVAARSRSIAELDRTIGEAEDERRTLISQSRGKLARNASLVLLDTDAVVADHKRDLQIQLLGRKIDGMQAAKTRLTSGDALALTEAAFARASNNVLQLRPSLDVAKAACTRANAAFDTFNTKWYNTWLNPLQWAERKRLATNQNDRCTEYNRAVETVRLANNAKTTRDNALSAYRNARGWTDKTIMSVTGDIEASIEKERTAAEGSWRARAELWAKEANLNSVLKTAAIALVGILLMPYLIRLLFYFVLAPVAMRRRGIRLHVPGGSGAAILPAARSTTSVSVRLEAGEELLVRQDYLQSTSEAGAKGTQWLMDRRHPLTSMATGMTFLTRIRGAGEATTISAVRDPFAEVTIMTMPAGGACVLQPRALAAIVQPIRQPLRVTSHWRLFSLNAWLTMQLRYLVFHGPARLVIKGGRGVRVEQAESGRVFGQEQLVGFSAELAYSVTRTETFWPYFLGREQLLKDRIEAGEGVLIVEEAPMAGRRASEVKQGLEGMVDAGMKAFGM